MVCSLPCAVNLGGPGPGCRRAADRAGLPSGGAGRCWRVFVIALVVLYFCLPATPHSKQVLKVLPWWTTFRQPRFVAFIIAYSSWLLSYT